MKKLVILFAALMVSVAAFSQEMSFAAPNFKKIKKEVKSKKGKYYYPKLIQRFNDADTTMTVDDLRHLYYGAVSLPDFNPYGYFEAQKKLNDLFKEEGYSKSDLEKGLSVVDKQLEKSPGSLYFLFFKYKICLKLFGEDSEEASKAANQVGMSLKAILSTGNGRSMDIAAYVLYICDEYKLLNIAELSPTRQELINLGKRSFDVLYVEENERGIEKLYFDVTIMKKNW